MGMIRHRNGKNGRAMRRLTLRFLRHENAPLWYRMRYALLFVIGGRLP